MFVNSFLWRAVSGHKSVLFSALGLVLFFSGCASVSVSETIVRPKPGGPVVFPETIYVRNYQAPPENLRVDREGEDLQAFMTQLQDRLSRNLKRRLAKHLAPTEIIATTAPTPSGPGWLLEGTFDRVNQGSRALRSLIGFGLGGTKIDATTKVYQLGNPKRREKPELIFVIRTTGGSGASPGAIGGFSPFGPLGPFGMIPNAIFGAQSGLAFDTNRTAREITAALSEFAWQEGLIPEDKALGPKRLGRIPNRVITSEPEPRQAPTP
jgi:hypothetical protein